MNEWERVLALLLDKSKELSPKNKEKKESSESQSRIIYRIDRHNNINPYLQKSKDGIVWSKGRIISLTTFQQGMSEMNETDHALTLCIKKLSNDWEKKPYALQWRQAYYAAGRISFGIFGRKS